VQKVITNAVRWATPIQGPYTDLSKSCHKPQPIEKVVIEE